MVVTKGDNQTDGWLGKVVDRQYKVGRQKKEPMLWRDICLVCSAL